MAIQEKYIPCEPDGRVSIPEFLDRRDFAEGFEVLSNYGWVGCFMDDDKTIKNPIIACLDYEDRILRILEHLPKSIQKELETLSTWHLLFECCRFVGEAVRKQRMNNS